MYFIICVEPFRIRRVGFVAWLQIGLFSIFCRIFYFLFHSFCVSLCFFFCLSPAGSLAKIYIDGHQERDVSASFDTLRPKRLDKQQFLSVFISLCVWVCNGVCGCVCMPFNSSYNCEAKSLALQLEALIKGRALI